jgi:hypothetical protein
VRLLLLEGGSKESLAANLVVDGFVTRIYLLEVGRSLRQVERRLLKLEG